MQLHCLRLEELRLGPAEARLAALASRQDDLQLAQIWRVMGGSGMG